MPYNYGGKLYRIIWWETLPYNNYGGKLYRIMVGKLYERRLREYTR